MEQLDTNQAAETTQPLQPVPPSVARELMFGAVGGAIAVGCVLPPILHFVTGPFGPLIGGFFAAQQVKPQARGRVIIAATIGLMLATLFAAIAFAIATFSGSGGPPDWFPSNDLVALIILGSWLYATVLAGVGVAISAMFQAKAAERT